MDIPALIDPELRPALDFPEELGAQLRENPAAVRAAFNEMGRAAAAALPPSDVQITEYSIPGPDGDVPIVIYTPPSAQPMPGLLWVHGGGYLLGSARDDAVCVPLARHVGCAIISVDYRLAPEHPFPAGTEDCYAALVWMAQQAESIGIDPARLAIGGASAGGGLTAGLALLNRDRGGPALVFQLLLYPMIDDRHDTPAGHAVTFRKVWNREISLYAWQLYLGEAYGSDSVSPYAAAWRATDVRNLPPAYLCVGTLDLFRDENIGYAQRLMAADVPVELAVYPGMTHGAEGLVPDAAISQRMRAGYMDALKRALSPRAAAPQ